MKEKRGEDTQDLFLEERMREIKMKKEKKMMQDKAMFSVIPGMANPYEEEEIRNLVGFRSSQEGDNGSGGDFD